MSVVLLTILKIIGIVLLSIAGLAIVLLSIILFVPVRYKAVITKDNCEDSNICIKGKVTWLLHIINLNIDYVDTLEYKLKLGPFKLWPSKKNKSEENFKSESVKTKKSIKKNEEKSKPSEEVEGESIEEDFFFEKDRKEEKDTIDELLNDNEEKSLKDFFRLLVELVKKLKLTVFNIYAKIKNIFDNIEYYIKVAESKEFKESVRLCGREIKRILKIILPRKVKGFINIGFEDPETIGKVFGAYSLIYPWLGKNLVLFPYNEKVFNGNVRLSGRITLISLLVSAYRVYFNKNIKHTLKMLKKEEN